MQRIGRKRSEYWKYSVHMMRMLCLVAIVCCASARADASPNESRPTSEAISTKPPAVQSVVGTYGNKSENGGVSSLDNLAPREMIPDQSSTTASEVTDVRQTALAAKWFELQSRIGIEQETLAACRSSDSSCSATARRFLFMIDLARVKQGRARLGEINRAVNLSIKPMTDLAQYGVADYWSAPLATLTVGAGDCEDYAILKYVALRESGINPEDLQLMIVRDIKRNALHAVLLARLDEEWVILDNRMLIMLNVLEARHYYPLFALDHRGVRDSVSTAFRR
jgi:predicted transglutaminase-like cysteine proteinase